MMSLAARSTATAAANFAAGNSSTPSAATTWSDPRAVSGPPGDNAATESFFGLLQNNVVDRRRWDTREQRRIAIVAWIERTYHHRRRRQVSLGRLTPIEFEANMTTPAHQAA